MRRGGLLYLALALPSAAALADARLERAFGDEVVRVSFEARGDLEILTGAMPGVVVEADDEEALEAVDVRIEDDRLVLSREARQGGLLGWLRRNAIRVRVIVRDLEQVAFAGSGDLRVSDVREGELHVEIAGAADCTLEAIDVDSLRVEIAGASDCDVSGVAGEQRVAIAGRGTYRGFELATERTEIELSGMGDVEVHARERLEADVSGMGDVAYRGSPELRERVSGWGAVTRAGGP